LCFAMALVRVGAVYVVEQMRGFSMDSGSACIWNGGEPEALKAAERGSYIFAALACFGPFAIPPLISAMQDKDAQMRANACCVLETFGNLARQGNRWLDTRAALPYLLDATREDQGWGIRSSAVRAIGYMGPAGADAVPILVKLLKDPDSKVSGWVLFSLGEIGPPAASAVPVLIKLLRDPNRNIRQFSARALGQIGPAANTAVPALREVMREDKCDREAGPAIEKIMRHATSR
jgi:HEAT repeat protein